MADVVALLQLDPTVGDVAGNVRLIEAAGRIAAEAGATLAITSELAVSGYPPRDLLLDPKFIEACAEATFGINTELPMIVGTPLPPAGDRQRPANGAVRVVPGRRSKVATRKQLLPTYDVFDEGRYFEGDSSPGILRLTEHLSLGVTICEDAWQHAGLVPSDYTADPIDQLAAWGHDGEALSLSINLSSSPFHLHKEGSRADVVRAAAKTLQHPFLLCNQVGGNDDLLFDGRSVAAWPDGGVVQAPAWQQGILLVDLEDPSNCSFLPLTTDGLRKGNAIDVLFVSADEKPSPARSDADLLEAVSLGLRDYCRKSGISQIVLGMSGGIDSAVSAAVACRAIGAENVLGLSMPSRHSSAHSVEDAMASARALGINLDTIEINELHDAADSALAHELEEGNPVAAENLQARLRGMLVMGVANARGAMVIATGNKSELAMGYCTLYGDMCGGYAPLGDLYKTEVYALAEAINAEAKQSGESAPINDSTLTKPPSGELAPGQMDEDLLPPYAVLDAILVARIERGLDAESIARTTAAETDTIAWVLARLGANEHKRWQMPPAPRVSIRAFGQGWRQPLAARKDGYRK
jgi:NAD+ synthase (glutamine-hydrolysing)